MPHACRGRGGGITVSWTARRCSSGADSRNFLGGYCCAWLCATDPLQTSLLPSCTCMCLLWAWGRVRRPPGWLWSSADISTSIPLKLPAPYCPQLDPPQPPKPGSGIGVRIRILSGLWSSILTTLTGTSPLHPGLYQDFQAFLPADCAPISNPRDVFYYVGRYRLPRLLRAISRPSFEGMAGLQTSLRRSH